MFHILLWPFSGCLRCFLGCSFLCFLKCLVLSFFLEQAGREIPNILERHLFLQALVVEFVTDGHRLENVHLLWKHGWQIDERRRLDILGLDPSEKICRSEQWNVAESHRFNLGKRKSMSCSHDALCDEPERLT